MTLPWPSILQNGQKSSILVSSDRRNFFHFICSASPFSAIKPWALSVGLYTSWWPPLLPFLHGRSVIEGRCTIFLWCSSADWSFSITLSQICLEWAKTIWINILTCHSRKSTGVNNKINDGWIPFSCFSVRVLVLCMLAHCHTRTEPSLMLFVTQAFATTDNVCCKKGLISFVLCSFSQEID